MIIETEEELERFFKIVNEINIAWMSFWVWYMLKYEYWGVS